MAFGLESLKEPIKSKMGLKECVQHNLVFGFEPLYESDDVDVAHFVFTVLLMPQGPLKLTTYPWSADLVKSDRVLAPETAELLKTSIRPKAKKASKK